MKKIPCRRGIPLFPALCMTFSLALGCTACGDGGGMGTAVAVMP